MRLKNNVYPPESTLACRGQRGANLGRMMAVVINDRHAR